MNVLVGSKEITLRRNIAYAVNGLGGRVVTTGKSSLFLVEVLEQDFDLAILDTEMEGMDGQETFRILRQMRPKLPLLYLYRENEDLSDRVQAVDRQVVTLKRIATETELVQAVETLASESVKGNVGPSRW